MRWRWSALALLAAAMAACDRPPDLARADPAAIAAIDSAVPGGAFPVGSAALDTAAGPLWLFYPATPGAAASPAPAGGAALSDPYLEALERRFGAVAAASLATASGPARHGASWAAGRFPLLLFAPGAGLGSRDYRLLLGDIASHGVVVAALDPLGSPPASEDSYRAMADALSRTATELDRSPLGTHLDQRGPVLAGHSLGGAAAVMALARTPRARAAIDIDGDFLPGLATAAPPRPLLLVTGPHSADPVRTQQRRSGDWATIAGGNADARRVVIGGMEHLDVTDAASLPAGIVPPEKRDGRLGQLGGAAIRARLVALMLPLIVDHRQPPGPARWPAVTQS